LAFAPAWLILANYYLPLSGVLNLQGRIMISKLISLSILLLVSSQVYAATFKKTNTIYQITSITKDNDRDYVLLDGFDTAGSCPLSQGLVVAKFPTTEQGSRAFSLAMAAKLSGKKVRLGLDDTYKNYEGYCFVVAIDIVE